MSFVSSQDLAAARQRKREQRQEFLHSEEQKFLEKQKAKQKHKDLGYDKWMLPSIEKRLEQDAAKMASVGKDKKHKKHKKKKKKKKKSSSESDESGSDVEWEEKVPTSTESGIVQQTQNWLTFDDVIGDDKTFTSKTLKEKRDAEKAALEQSSKDEEQIGQHPNELNPYWKDGGKGLPEEDSGKKKNTINKDWLLRSLKRMNEQAEEQGKSIESIAAERYGSWEEFQRLLREADHRGRSNRHISDREGVHKSLKKQFVRPDEDQTRSRFARPRDDDDSERSFKYSSRDSHKHSKKRDRNRDHRPSWRKTLGDDPSRKRSQRSRDRSPRRRSQSPDHIPLLKKKKDSNMPKLKTDASEKRDCYSEELCMNSALARNQELPQSKEKLNHQKYTSLDHSLSKKSDSKSDQKNVTTVANESNVSSFKSDDLSFTEKDKNQLAAKILKAEMMGNAALAQTLKNKLAKAKEDASVVTSSKTSKTDSIPVVKLTEKEKNQLAARILKAELMGNDALVKSLKLKLEKSKQAEAEEKQPKKATNEAPEAPSASESDSEDETVVLTRVGKDGQSWPLQQSEMSYGSLPTKRRKKTKVPTHKDGQRERYFGDDDRYSLEDLVRREKTEESEDQHAMFSRLASKQFQGTDSEYFTLDDMYVSEASRRNTRTEEEQRQKHKAIADHKKLARRLENCRLCFGNKELPKHLLIAIGKKSYLMLPEHKPLCEGHCFIVPMHHCNTGTSLDEDIWDEMRRYMRSLKSMFKAKDMDCVFMQTCIALKKSKHFFIDCIPLPEEEGGMAPIYFKKAIQESESEWSHNKKLVDTRGKDVLKCIPKGLPYFSVDFGMDGGFAHVVEDEMLFPAYFGREVVGGMLDVEPRLWRHPPKDHFTEQTKRSVKFSEWWKPYDWTCDISGTS